MAFGPIPKLIDTEGLPIKGFKQVAVGSRVFLGIGDDDKVYGMGTVGLLGLGGDLLDGSTEFVSRPRLLDPNPVISVAVFDSTHGMVCYVTRSDRVLKCSGKKGPWLGMGPGFEALNPGGMYTGRFVSVDTSGL